MGDLTLQVDDLRRAANRIFAALERNYGKSIDLDEDYYWHLDVDDAYEMSAVPTIDLVGQVTDDVAELRAFVASDNNEVDSIWHELNHLIGVLRVIEKQASP
jgi:hypothetical protein